MSGKGARAVKSKYLRDMATDALLEAQWYGMVQVVTDQVVDRLRAEGAFKTRLCPGCGEMREGKYCNQGHKMRRTAEPAGGDR